MNGGNSGLTNGNQLSMQQSEYEKIAKSNEMSVGFLVDDTSNHSDFSQFSKKIQKDKQGKHVKGDKNYKQGKSYLTISLSKLQKLIDSFSGKGQTINSNKERIDFGKEIGVYVDPVTSKKSKTTIGIVHYSKNGTHVVPARPKEV